MRLRSSLWLLPLLCGCHLLIDAEAHLGPDAPRDAGRDASPRDSATVDSAGPDPDTGTADAGPACASDSTLCEPRTITGCSPSGCQTCTPREIDAAGWLPLSAGSPMMDRPVFDLKIENAGGDAYLGLVAAAFGGPGAQQPWLTVVPLGTAARVGEPAAIDLTASLPTVWQNTSALGFASELDPELFVSGAAGGSEVIQVLSYNAERSRVGLNGARSGPSTTMPSGRIAHVTRGGGGSTQNVFVWPSPPMTETPTEGVLGWLDQGGASDTKTLPPVDFATGVSVRGSAGGHALVQSLTALGTTYVYAPPVDGAPQFDLVPLEATAPVDWLQLEAGRYLAAVPEGNQVTLKRVDTASCAPNCEPTSVGRVSYAGSVLVARVVQIDQALALATLTQVGSERVVKLRLLTRTDFMLVPPPSALMGADPNDWLSAATGPQTRELVLAPSPLHSTALYLGLAWADAEGSGSSRLEARFLAFDGCGSE